MTPNAADVSSPQFWAQPYRVPASSDPDTATAQTIGIMCGHVRAGAQDEAVRQSALGAVAQFGGLEGSWRPQWLLYGNEAKKTAAIAAAIWWWCKLYVKFVHHEFIIRQKLGESGHLQGLISPEVLVRMAKPEGDCAIFSECIAAFLSIFGVPYEFVTVAVNPNEPEIFSHVYVYAVLPDGSRLPLDASHGDYPGWQVPSGRVSRRQVWDSNGSPVADRGSRFDGLHNYGLRGGLGTMVCDETGFCYDDGTGATAVTPPAGAPVLPSYPTSIIPPCTCVNGTCIEDGNSCSSLYTTPTGTPYSGPAMTAPAQNSAQWASFATALAKMGFQQAAINSIQPGTVVSANGAILRQNPGYAVPVGSASSLSTSLSTLGSGNTILYIGVAAIAALLLLGKK